MIGNFTELSQNILKQVGEGKWALVYHIKNTITKDEIVKISKALTIAFPNDEFNYNEDAESIFTLQEEGERTLIFYNDHNNEWGYEIERKDFSVEGLKRRIEIADAKADLDEGYSFYDIKSLEFVIINKEEILLFLEKYAS